MRTRLAFVAALQLLLAVTLLLAACDDGGNSSSTASHHSAPTATPSPTITPTPDPAAALTLNLAAGDSASGLDLHIVGLTQSSGGQAIPITYPNTYPKLGIACNPGLAFASPNPTAVSYSPSDLQAIRDYVRNVPLAGDGAYPIPDSQPPSTLRWLPFGWCNARLDIHNGGSQDVTISSVGLQLVADPAPNTYHYAQLDLCSVSGRFNFCGPAGEGPDGGYVADVSLGSGGRAGTVFPGDVAVGDASDASSYPLPLLLSRGQTTSITVRISPADAQVPGAIYQIVPQLTVSDTTTHVLTFSGLKQTLVFADRSQISCYGLSGNSVAPPSQISYPSDIHPYC